MGGVETEKDDTEGRANKSLKEIGLFFKGQSKVLEGLWQKGVVITSAV